MLLTGATDPVWSPDGTKLAYVNTGVGIAVVTVSGGVAGSPTTLVAAATASAPTWSADGTAIAYVDGGAIEKVASSGGTPSTVDAGPNDADPAWSPDGTKIAFSRQIAGHYDVMVTNADGSGGTTPLTSNVAGDDRHPSWSPDGSLIAYSSSSGGSPLLYDMNSDGSAQTKLGPSGGVQGDDPAFSPDSTLILFAGASGLETLDDSAGTPTTFISGAGLADPDWQPISNTIPSSGPPQIVTYPVINLPTGFDAPQLGLFLTASTGTWTGKTPMTFKYQWTKCDDKAATKPCYDIAGATSSFFTPTPDLVGWDVSITITATNDQGSLYVRALPTKPVTGAIPVNHGSPQVAGLNAVGSTLTANTGVWRGYFPITYTYQWERCDPLGTLTSCVPIAGATTSAYVLQPADLNQTIRVFVTATNAVGSTTQFSNHTFPTLPKPKIKPAAVEAPILTGEARDGSTLVLVQGTWSGDTPMQYAIFWLRCDATGDACVTVSRAGTRSDRYLLRPADVGATMVAAVVATNDGGATQVRTGPTDAVVSLPPSLRHGRHLVGGPGADYLAGGGGNDVIYGGAGNDTIKGGSGDDRLYGGAGNDVIDGGPGTDTISAGPGSDTVRAADGAVDTIDCGPGNDRAVVDSFDKVRNCEVVSISSSGPSAGTGLRARYDP